MEADPLDAAFGKVEELHAPDRTRLAKLIVPFVTIDPESGALRWNRDVGKPKQRILILLLSRLALSIRNPSFSPALAPKEIETLLDMPGGTIRPKLSELSKEKVITQEDGVYSARVSALRRAEQVLDDILPKEDSPQ